MDLFRISMTAGERVQLSQKGRFFRLLEGEGDIRLEASNGVDSKIINGIGVDMRSEDGQGFDWFALTSETTQVVAVMVSNLPTTDSRLSGVININQIPPVEVTSMVPVDVETMPEVSPARPRTWLNAQYNVVTGSHTVVLSNKPDRFSATIQPTVDVWIAGDSGVGEGNGLLIESGQSFTVENTGPLWAKAAATNGKVRVMESVK